MKKFRRAAWIALLAGVVSLLIVPLIVPVESSGTLTEAELAGDKATFVEIEGIEVHYEFLDYQGSGTTPPLFVLLHGFGASTFSWREVLADFSSLGDVVAYDRPAFGLTSRPTSWEGASPYGVEKNLDLLQGVIGNFAKPGQPVVLVGHSAGGTLSAEFALRTPEALDGLILVAPAIVRTGGGPSWLSWLYSVPQVDRVGPLLVAGIATSGSELLERSWHNQELLTQEIRDGYRQPLRIKGWEAAFWEFQKAPRDFRVTESYKDLALPVFIITGDDDQVVSTADSLALHRALPGSGVAVIPASGHLPQEETPGEFMAAVGEGLQQLFPEMMAANQPVEPVITEVFNELPPESDALVDCAVLACVALTFDDGPGPYTAEVLEILAQYDASATFYVVGQAVKAWTSMARLIVEGGHDIGNHTMTHPKLSSVSNASQRDEIAQLDALVFELVGVHPGTIRPPYGDLPKLGIPDAHQRPVVLWSVDSFDWKKRSASRIARDVIDQAGPGDIILMHEISRRGVDALPAILEGLHGKGLTVVSVAQLLGTEFRYAEAIERVPYRCPLVAPASELNPWCQAVD